MPPWPGAHGTQPSRMQAIVMGLMLLAMITEMIIQGRISRAVEDTNKQWRTAAASVFEERGKPEMANHATPEDLQHFLDPCYPADYRERTLTKGCDRTIRIDPEPR